MAAAPPTAPQQIKSADKSAAGDPAWGRLVDQLAWYDRKSTGAQQSYKRLKMLELLIAAAVPVVAGAHAPATLTAALGAAVVVLEAVQHLYQWQTNWVLYRSTAEALKHEKFLSLSEAGPYAGNDRRRQLAERLEGLISQEHAKWTQGTDQTSREHGVQSVSLPS